MYNAYIIQDFCPKYTKTINNKKTNHLICKGTESKQTSYQRKYADGKQSCGNIFNIIVFRELQIKTGEATTHLLKWLKS